MRTNSDFLAHIVMLMLQPEILVLEENQQSEGVQFTLQKVQSILHIEHFTHLTEKYLPTYSIFHSQILVT